MQADRTTGSQPQYSAGARRFNAATALAIAAGVAAFVVYASTLFPGVGGLLNHGDSAKFQYLGVVPGIGHAPGNPLYLLLLGVIQRISVGDPALRANLLSAILGAVSVALTANTAYRLAGGAAAVVSAILLAVGGTQWLLSTEAEVYTLSGALVAYSLLALTRAELERCPRQAALALGAAMLGLANHLSLALMWPALLVACWSLYRRGLPLSTRSLQVPVACALATAALYGLLPALDTLAAYSEYPEQRSWRSFFYFVSGQRWHGNLALGSLSNALQGRSTSTVATLLKQWTLPLWLVAPIGLYRLADRAPASAIFATGASGALTGLIFLYKIPDPDGLTIAIATCLAPAMGATIAGCRFPKFAALAAGIALVPTAVHHLQRRPEVGFEVLEDVFLPKGNELLDLPGLINAIPRGAYWTVPCYHYGCAQLTNYFRFADDTAAERGAQLVTLLGGGQPHWDSPPPVLDPVTTIDRAICTIHKNEAAQLRRAGHVVRKISRPVQRHNGRVMTPLLIHCTTPSPRQGKATP